MGRKDQSRGITVRLLRILASQAVDHAAAAAAVGLEGPSRAFQVVQPLLSVACSDADLDWPVDTTADAVEQ